MPNLLFDPLILFPFGIDQDDTDAIGSFVERLVGWASDARAAVGVATFERVCQHYAETGYPNAPVGEGVPNYLRREYGRALNRVLSRLVRYDGPLAMHDTYPRYIGPADLERLLIGDLAGSVGCNVAGIATDFAHWDPQVSELRLRPGPPEVTYLCTMPNMELALEADARVHAFFSGRRIHIVGGRPRDSIPTVLASALGVCESDVVWMPAEKGKPPRGIRKRWSFLDPAVDVTGCLTGCIGHSESEVARRAAEARGVPHVRAETVADLVQGLIGEVWQVTRSESTAPALLEGPSA